MPNSSTNYEVVVTYCNDRNFKHGHENLGEAMEEYSWMMAVAIDPSLLTSPNSRHIQRVTFIGYDADGNITQHIYSPHFDCKCPDKIVA